MCASGAMHIHPPFDFVLAMLINGVYDECLNKLLYAYVCFGVDLIRSEVLMVMNFFHL